MSGRQAAPRIRTRRLIEWQCGALLAVAAVTLVALFAGYHGVHRNPGAVRDTTSPAIREVAATRTALQSAHRAARENLTSALADVRGKGEQYETQISAADQSLARVGELQVAGAAGRQILQPVPGLLKAYTESIDKAARAEGDKLLRDAYLTSARSILYRDETGILDRLDKLQDKQRLVLGRETSFGTLLWTAWSTAWTGLVTLVVLLVVAQLTLRRRFRRRLNPFLAAATVIIFAALWPTMWAAQTQSRLNSARSDLSALIASQKAISVRADKGEEPSEQTLTTMRHNITLTADEVRKGMDATEGRAAAIDWIPGGGLSVGVLILIGIIPRIVEYRIQPR